MALPPLYAGFLLDLHASCAGNPHLPYVELYPYLDSLWFGEQCEYAAPPAAPPPRRATLPPRHAAPPATPRHATYPQRYIRHLCLPRPHTVAAPATYGCSPGHPRLQVTAFHVDEFMTMAAPRTQVRGRGR